MKNVVNWLRNKHTSIVQSVGVIIGAGQVYGWWNLSSDEISAIMALIGILWLLIGSQTNTSNLRLTGKSFTGPNGIDKTNLGGK